MYRTTKWYKSRRVVVKTGGCIRFKLCSSCPYKDEFWSIFENVNTLTSPG
ncbi:MAG: hypothetical protein RSB70_03415 [Clostridium sp.]